LPPACFRNARGEGTPAGSPCGLSLSPADSRARPRRGLGPATRTDRQRGGQHSWKRALPVAAGGRGDGLRRLARAGSRQAEGPADSGFQRSRRARAAERARRGGRSGHVLTRRGPGSGAVERIARRRGNFEKRSAQFPVWMKPEAAERESAKAGEPRARDRAWRGRRRAPDVARPALAMPGIAAPGPIWPGQARTVDDGREDGRGGQYEPGLTATVPPR